MVQSKTDPRIPRSIRPLACHIIFIITILIAVTIIIVALVRATPTLNHHVDKSSGVWMKEVVVFWSVGDMMI